MAGAGRDEQRYCPICEKRMSETLCPEHRVKTVLHSAVMSSTAQLAPGTLVDERYRIDFVLGGGAMGTVYAATQTRMERRVALKVMSRELMRDGTELKRFYREAKNASRIKHPNVVQVYDFGVDETTQLPFLAMELVDGKTLGKLLADHASIDVHRTAVLLEQVAKALVAAHALGIVHRDLKPDNMMVSQLAGGDEHVTVLDFGIAKATRTPGGLQDSLTASGVIIGTPRYMAPEQITGQDVDHRADLYALGCIMHEMLTGEPPFAASDSLGVMLKHINAVRPPLPDVTSDAGLQAGLVNLHRALLRQDREHRPVSADRVAAIFQRIARRQPLEGIDNRLHSPTDAVEPWSRPDVPVPISPPDGPGLTDTHVKQRPVPTPVDSEAFSDLGFDGEREAHVALSPPPPRKRALLLAMVPLVVVGLGAAVWAAQKTERAVDAEPLSPVSRAKEERPDPVDDPSPRSVEAVEADRAPPAERVRPATPPRPKKIEITFAGTPKGAVVYDADRQQVCRGLPCTVQVSRGTKRLRYSVESGNHYAQRFTVSPKRGRRISVKLLPRLAEPTY